MKNNDKSLKEIFLNHTGKLSDKWSIYLSTYDEILEKYRNRRLRILEIGIQNGGSLEVWNKYFNNIECLIGVDIDEKCSNLDYEDTNIHLIIGDVNTQDTYNKICEISEKFDIIIDDGSHRSSDIIETYAKYWTLLEIGGVFIFEDLHCSYWQKHEGGLNYPYSSMNFFKKFADYINHEHWGISDSAEKLFGEFSTKYKIKLNKEELDLIHSVTFVNSLCIITKRKSNENRLGKRYVIGTSAQVSVAPLSQNDKSICVPSQKDNQYAILSEGVAEEYCQLFVSINGLSFIEKLSYKNNASSGIIDLNGVTNLNITRMRFDPSNKKCIISNFRAWLIDERGNNFECEIIRHNALLIKDEKYFFDTNDSQFYLSVPITDPKFFKYRFEIEDLESSALFTAYKLLEIK